jgi:hypothetical protein
MPGDPYQYNSYYDNEDEESQSPYGPEPTESAAARFIPRAEKMISNYESQYGPIPTTNPAQTAPTTSPNRGYSWSGTLRNYVNRVRSYIPSWGRRQTYYNPQWGAKGAQVVRQTLNE